MMDPEGGQKSCGELSTYIVLGLWKVREGWLESRRKIRQLGYRGFQDDNGEGLIRLVWQRSRLFDSASCSCFMLCKCG